MVGNANTRVIVLIIFTIGSNEHIVSKHARAFMFLAQTEDLNGLFILSPEGLQYDHSRADKKSALVQWHCLQYIYDCL